MFGFIIKYFFSCNALKFVSMNNQEYKVRPEVLDSNSNEPSFYPYSILMIHILNYVFLMLLKAWISSYLI